MALRLLLIAPVLLLAALAACGESEEVTLSPSAGETSATPAASATPTALASPSAAATVPADWATFQDAQFFKDGSFRYPPAWQREDNRVLSLGTAEWPSVCIPPTEMLIEASAAPAEEVSRPEKATDLTLGPYSGWELFEDATEGCPGRAHTVAIEREGLVYSLILVTGLEVDGEDVFGDAVDSLRISGD